MTVAHLTFDPAFAVGDVDPRLFGSFVEHMGRCVYTGVFEPGHPRADADGFRTDVLEHVRDLGVTLVRYPGGNFVSNYRWEDGVGPIGDRPTRLDLAWRAVETNAFGLNEFMRWAQQARVTPMMAANLGTRGVAEAAELVEYCNVPGGTAASDLRRKHGVAAPHDIRLWCLGNEMDGPWQVGNLTAEEYGRLAARAGHAMKRVDPSIELVACGSSHADMPTFAAWEAAVLERAYDQVDYISLHTYYDPEKHDEASFRAAAVDLDGFIDNVVATADFVRARLRKQKRIRLALDEWNVWYQSRFTEPEDRGIEELPALIEDDYTVTDAMVVGNLLISMLRHADRLAIGCQAQLVNIIAPIRTEAGGPSWRQTIFHPFAHTARLARGTVLRAALTAAPTMPTGRFGDVPTVDAVATLDRETGALSVFAVNRGTEAVPVELDLRAFPALRATEHLVLADADPGAVNTRDHPERAVPRRTTPPVLDAGRTTVLLPPVSWHALSLTPEETS